MKTRREWTMYWVKKRWARIVRMMREIAAITGETEGEAMTKQIMTPGHYKKFNGRCDCRMCKMGKERYSRAKEKRTPIDLD